MNRLDIERYKGEVAREQLAQARARRGLHGQARRVAAETGKRESTPTTAGAAWADPIGAMGAELRAPLEHQPAEAGPPPLGLTYRAVVPNREPDDPEFELRPRPWWLRYGAHPRDVELWILFGLVTQKNRLERFWIRRLRRLVTDPETKKIDPESRLWRREFGVMATGYALWSSRVPAVRAGFQYRLAQVPRGELARRCGHAVEGRPPRLSTMSRYITRLRHALGAPMEALTPTMPTKKRRRVAPSGGLLDVHQPSIDQAVEYGLPHSTVGGKPGRATNLYWFRGEDFANKLDPEKNGLPAPAGPLPELGDPCASHATSPEIQASESAGDSSGSVSADADRSGGRGPPHCGLSPPLERPPGITPAPTTELRGKGYEGPRGGKGEGMPLEASPAAPDAANAPPTVDGLAEIWARHARGEALSDAEMKVAFQLLRQRTEPEPGPPGPRGRRR